MKFTSVTLTLPESEIASIIKIAVEREGWRVGKVQFVCNEKQSVSAILDVEKKEKISIVLGELA